MVEGDSEKGEPVEVKGGCPHMMPCFSPCVAKFRKGGKLVATATMEWIMRLKKGGRMLKWLAEVSWIFVGAVAMGLIGYLLYLAATVPP